MSAQAPRGRALRALSLLISVAVLVLISGSISQSAIITFDTPSGSYTGGKPVSAEVRFTTSANSVQVVLTNMLENPTSIVQCLSGLQFHLSGGQTTATLLSSGGLERSISGTGSYADTGTVSTGWSLRRSGSDLMLDDLRGDAPRHTLVGPPSESNIYSNSNSLIADGSHNPYLGASATFSVKVPGVTAASTITSARFQFNMSSCNTVCGIVVVPEPAAAAMAAILGVAGLTRRPRAVPA